MTHSVRIWIHLVLIVVIYMTEIHSYPRGAPTSACDTGLPVHSQDGKVFEPQTSPPPYQINVNVLEFEPGDMITINITSKQRLGFKGLFLQVRLVPNPEDENFNDIPLGRFYRHNENTKPITCDISLETETHKDPYVKQNLTIDWKSPLLMKHDVVVRATILTNFSTFWSNIESPRVKLIRGKQLPVESLEKPWLSEIIKTVAAAGDKKASRDLTRLRFEKGFENTIDPNGYIMVNYVTYLLPFENSYHKSTITAINGTTIPNKLSNETSKEMDKVAKTDSLQELTIIKTDSVTDSSENGDAVSVPGNTTQASYELLVKALLRGDESVARNLSRFIDGHG